MLTSILRSTHKGTLLKEHDSMSKGHHDNKALLFHNMGVQHVIIIGVHTMPMPVLENHQAGISITSIAIMVKGRKHKHTRY